MRAVIDAMLRQRGRSPVAGRLTGSMYMYSTVATCDASRGSTAKPSRWERAVQAFLQDGSMMRQSKRRRGLLVAVQCRWAAAAGSHGMPVKRAACARFQIDKMHSAEAASPDGGGELCGEVDAAADGRLASRDGASLAVCKQASPASVVDGSCGSTMPWRVASDAASQAAHDGQAGERGVERLVADPRWTARHIRLRDGRGRRRRRRSGVSEVSETERDHGRGPSGRISGLLVPQSGIYAPAVARARPRWGSFAAFGSTSWLRTRRRPTMRKTQRAADIGPREGCAPCAAATCVRSSR